MAIELTPEQKSAFHGGVECPACAISPGICTRPIKKTIRKWDVESRKILDDVRKRMEETYHRTDFDDEDILRFMGVYVYHDHRTGNVVYDAFRRDGVRYGDDALQASYRYAGLNPPVEIEVEEPPEPYTLELNYRIDSEYYPHNAWSLSGPPPFCWGCRSKIRFVRNDRAGLSTYTYFKIKDVRSRAMLLRSTHYLPHTKHVVTEFEIDDPKYDFIIDQYKQMMAIPGTV